MHGLRGLRLHRLRLLPWGREFDLREAVAAVGGRVIWVDLARGTAEADLPPGRGPWLVEARAVSACSEAAPRAA